MGPSIEERGPLRARDDEQAVFGEKSKGISAPRAGWYNIKLRCGKAAHAAPAVTP